MMQPPVQPSTESLPKNTHDEKSRARLLIVDDEERNVHLLRRVLQKGGYTQIESTGDSRNASRLYEEFAPDLVLLDLRMPFKDGFEVMRELHEITPPSSFVPIIILTADVTPEAKQQALAGGANDFLAKPFDIMEVLLRVENLLRTRTLNQSLEDKVAQRTQALEAAQVEILRRLAQAAEFRDDDTGQHTRRVGHMAAVLARSLGWDEAEAQLMEQAAPLHDVGKIGISDLILLKPGKLTAEEFDDMKRHTTIGANLLAGSQSRLMQLAESIALSHHERWDGSGYPAKLAGEEIPLEGRILSIVDVFDALCHERPYKKAWPIADAIAEIEKQSGAQFDPQIVAAFLKLPQADFL